MSPLLEMREVSDRSGMDAATRVSHRPARVALLSEMQLWRAGQGTPEALQSPGGWVWVYALRSQCLRTHSVSCDLTVPADFALISERPPADWALTALSEDDLVLRIGRARWPAQGASSGALPDPGVVLSASQSRMARQLLELWGQAQALPASEAGQGAWPMHLQETLLSFLSGHCPAPVSTEPPLEPALPARDQRRLSRLTDYMTSRLGAPLSSEDLARAAGLSVRALHALCQRHFKVTPMELLRNLRLDAVQNRLRSDPDASVGDVALTLGFGHLGRFSAYYRARFGELPTETRARHAGGGRWHAPPTVAHLSCGRGANGGKVT